MSAGATDIIPYRESPRTTQPATVGESRETSIVSANTLDTGMWVSEKAVLFSRLMTEMHRPLVSFIGRKLADAGLGNDTNRREDIFQNVMLNLWRNINTFDPSRGNAYLFTLAANSVIDYCRRNKHFRNEIPLRADPHSDTQEEQSPTDRLESKEHPPGHAIQLREDVRALRLAMAKRLTDLEREAIRLVFFENLKYREAAAEMNVPVGTIKSRIASAKKHLSEEMEQKCDPSGVKDIETEARDNRRNDQQKQNPHKRTALGDREAAA